MPSFKNKRVAIDSMIMIYLLDQHPMYWKKIVSLLEEAREVIMSTLVYGEVMTGFYRHKEHELVDNFLSFMENRENIAIRPFDKNTAILFAQLRADYPAISPPDCIHLATALAYKADVFFSNDKKLSKIKEIPVVILQNFK